jgi:YhcH/YjgK/YiaL family protein
MILDQLSVSAAYESLHPLFPQAFAYLRAFDPQTADGKYELQGQDLVAIVQRYQTAPSADKMWEAHQVYGDVQVVYQGLEHCGHTDQTTLTVTKPYVAEKDVEKYMPPASASTLLKLGRANFAVFYPQDAHQPGVQIGTPGEILKVVIKFRLKA